MLLHVSGSIGNCETGRQNCSSKCSEGVLAKVMYYLVYPSDRLPQSGCVETVCFTSFNVFMWTQTWPLADLQQLDKEGRKIIVDNNGNHPLGSIAQLYN